MRLKDAARIFSSGHLKKLAEGDISFLSLVASELRLVQTPKSTICDLYDQVYQKLNESYRHEYYYKNTLVNKQLLGRHSLNTTVMLSEFRVGSNIADCVILNGRTICYEIKTEYDSLNRLEEQLNSYCSLFDKVYVVCNEKHFEKVSILTPENVGILLLTERNTLSEQKKATDLINLEVNKELLMNSLRAEEYKKLAELISGSVPKVSNIKMHSACYEIIYKASSFELRQHFRETLKYYRKNNASFIKSLPKSLKNVEVSYKLSNRAQSQLINILNNNLSKDLACTTQFSEVSSLN